MHDKRMPRITNWLKEQLKENIRELEKQGVSRKDIARSFRDALREMKLEPPDDAA